MFGGLSTLSASYLAKTRSMGEPEASDQMVRELESFVRDCSMCLLDHGHLKGDGSDLLVHSFQDRFEQILENAPKGLTDRIKKRVHGSGGGGVGGGGGGGGGGGNSGRQDEERGNRKV